MLQWHASPLGFNEWAYEPIFQTLSIAPQPLCTACVGRAVRFLVLGAISMCLLEAGLVKA